MRKIKANSVHKSYNSWQVRPTEGMAVYCEDSIYIIVVISPSLQLFLCISVEMNQFVIRHASQRQLVNDSMWSLWAGFPVLENTSRISRL